MSDIRVFLVDDEEKVVRALSDLITQHFPSVRITGTAGDVKSALTQLKKEPPDLLLLDVDLGKQTGFHLLEQIESINFHVAFVTAFNEYALRAIKFLAIDYLLKPVLIEDLRGLFEKLEAMERRCSGYTERLRQVGKNVKTSEKGFHQIAIPISSGYHIIRVNEIYHLEASGSYTLFHLKGGDRVISSYNLRVYQRELESYGFYRIHHSILVNTRYIRKVVNKTLGSVVMEDGTELPIAKARKADFLKHNYL